MNGPPHEANKAIHKDLLNKASAAPPAYTQGRAVKQKTELTVSS
jgi:hypothetical protein